uniref:Uncharacterized protein n=1 Tax=Anguilla anguilla TaxID=7936 RepID=A0A0E9WQF9_ANGAN
MGSYGTCLHLFWVCPAWNQLWKYVISILASLLNMADPLCPPLLLLEDDTHFNLNI